MKQASILHPRSQHHGQYNLFKLSKAHKPLVGHIQRSPRGDKTINFASPKAVLALNTALVKLYYGLSYYDVPEGFLCPPIPGRADYVHYLADLLEQPTANANIRVLDIGTGANLIYPIIGHYSYQWQFVGSELNPTAYKAAQLLIDNNQLGGSISLVKQDNPKQVLAGVIGEHDRFDAVMCNPPFHSSAAQASQGSSRKVRQLNKHKQVKAVPKLNFGGQSNELWCEGGEVGFIKQMIHESLQFKDQVTWFTSLVSKSESLDAIKRALKRAKLPRYR